MTYCPHERPDDGEEESYEDEYFVDCEVDVNGILITPDNTIVHHYQPRCWDSIEVEIDENQFADIIVEDFVIVAMIKSGFLWKDHGPPTDGYKEWYILSAVAPLDAELQAFYDEL